MFREGRFLVGPLMTVYFLRTDTGETCVGFAVGKKTGGAVVRNRLKRILREASRTLQTLLPPGCDLVVLARAPMKEATLSEVREALERLMVRIRP